MTKENNNNDNEILNSANIDEIDSVYLTFEDDEEVKCEIIGVFEVGDKEYIALLPEDGEEDEDEDEILIYGYKEKEEELELIQIEDDQELDKVSKAYYELFEEDNEEE